MNNSKDIYDAFLHAEVVGQARLNNFLMTGTIVLVGCAVSLQITDSIIGPMVSIALATLGISFSRMWYYLGCRQRLYHHYIEWHIDKIVELNPTDSSNILVSLRDFHQRLVPTGVRKNKDGRPEEKYSSRRLLTVVPRYFIATYAFVCVASWVSLCVYLYKEVGAYSMYASIFILAITICIIGMKYGTKIRNEIKLLCTETTPDQIIAQVNDLMK